MIPGGMSDLTIPEYDVPVIDEGTREELIQRVYNVAQQLPKWNVMSTHYEDCWKQHTECLAVLILDVIRQEQETEMHDPLCGWGTLQDCFPAEDCGECALIERVRSAFLAQAKSVINDRVIDLKSCGKDDDCESVAYGAELALDDLQEYMRRGQSSVAKKPVPHDSLCPVYTGSCCPWMGDCTCQCLCEFITEVRDDERGKTTQDTPSSRA